MVPPPPARERSRSRARPPAPAAGSHSNGGEQASPRQRARTPHRSRPEKAGEHEPERYGGQAPHDQNDASDTRYVACPGKAEGRNEAEQPPALQAPPAAQTGGTAHGPLPPPPARPPAHERHGLAPRGAHSAKPGRRTAPHHPCGTQPPQGVQAKGTVLGPHTHTPAPTACGWRTPTARPVGGQSKEGERLTSDAPRNSGRHPTRGRPSATPTAPSQVGGNLDRTAPPQARQTGQGTRAGHAEGHGPRGTAPPAPSAGTARGAHATPPRRGGERTPRERERTHTQKARGDYQTGNRTELAERTDRVEWRTSEQG